MNKLAAITRVNIRSTPSKEAEIWGNLNPGDLVNELDAAGWCPIEMEDGSTGWIAREYLKEAPADTQEEPEKEQPSEAGVIYQVDLEDMFGSPRDPAPYLIVFSLADLKPHFPAVKDYEGNPWSFKIYGHKLMEAPVRQAFKNLIDRGFAQELKTFDGCTCVRPMTGGGGWSVHSWGLAIDMNAQWNPYGFRPIEEKRGKNGVFSAGFVNCFIDAGLEWGGCWHNADGMHFQLPRV